VVVVGESMSRVEKAAEQLRQQGLDVRTYDPREGTRNSMEANRSWLRYWTKVRQATVVDIGTDPNRTIPSVTIVQLVGQLTIMVRNRHF
jgi:hypothetical protein